MGSPDVPTVPERQAAQLPKGDVRTRLSDRDARRRGYAATMYAPTASAAPGTSNILGV